MLNFILQPLAEFIIYIISTLGYAGVVLAMVIQSAGIPLPSEVTMPFAGFLISRGVFNFWLVTISGGIGSLIGAVIAYSLGYHGGEPLIHHLIRKYGKYVLICESDFNQAKKWFEKHDELIIFFSRLLPVIRTFISVPAGIAKMNFKKFSFYTLTGSLISTGGLAYIGKVLGENWNTLGSWFHKFDFLIVLLGLGAVVYYVKHKLKKSRRLVKSSN